MVRPFVGLVGVLFVLLGFIGFFTHDLFGLMHFDIAHNVIHLVIGAAGLAAMGTEETAVKFAKVLGLVYIAMGVIGIMAPNIFGIMHMENAENVMHIVIGVISLYLGFTAQTIQTVKLKSKMH